MNEEEIKAKSLELAALYTANANGKTVQMLRDGKWTDSTIGVWSADTLSYGPNFGSDLSRWRVKPEPRRRWEVEYTKAQTESEDTAKKWKAAGYSVTEWQEVLPE